MINFIEYPKCSTCINAKKWLIANNIEFNDRHIVEDTPSKEELKTIIEKSDIEINKFFNTSGKLYRELNIKEKLASMTDDEKIELLASNGMLIKRPIIEGEDFSFAGFKEDKYRELLIK